MDCLSKICQVLIHGACTSTLYHVIQRNYITLSTSRLCGVKTGPSGLPKEFRLKWDWVVRYHDYADGFTGRDVAATLLTAAK